jgi:hypothetical protein
MSALYMGDTCGMRMLAHGVIMGGPGRFTGFLVATAAGLFAVLAPVPALADAALAVSPNPVSPGDTVTFTGTGFDRCAEPDTGSTAVLLSWTDGSNSAVATGSYGNVTASVTVPAATSDGDYIVVAQCYDPSTSSAFGPDLASTTLTVKPPTSDCASECDPVVALSAAAVHPGDTITVTGTGFLLCTQAQRQIELFWDGSPLASGPVPDQTGQFNTTAMVPTSSSTGTHKLAAACMDPSTDAIIAWNGQHVQVTPGPVSASSSPAQTASPALSTAQTTNATPTASTTQTTNQVSPGSVTPPGSSGPPGAVIGGVSAGLGMAFLLGFLLLRAVRRSRAARWGPQGIRAVAAGALGPPSAQVSASPGATSISLRLEPRGDLTGSQKVTEVDW